MKKVKVTHDMVSAHIDKVYRELGKIPEIVPKTKYPPEILKKVMGKHIVQLEEIKDRSALVVSLNKVLMTKDKAIKQEIPHIVIYSGFSIDKYLITSGKNNKSVSIMSKTAVKKLAYEEIQQKVKSVNSNLHKSNPGWAYLITRFGEDFALVTYTGLVEYVDATSGLDTFGCTEKDICSYMGDDIQEKIKLAVPPKKDIFKFSSSCYDLETLLDKYIIAKGNDVYTAEDIENEMVPEDLEAFKSLNPKEYEACIMGDVEPLARVIAVNVGEGKGRYIFVEDANKYIEMFGSPAVSWVMSK